MTHKLKLLLIGLDGATFKVLDPIMQAGHMPRLTAILRQSATATLLSTVPPITALAWPTIMTGKNPGKHGILGWQEPLNDAFERPWTNARQVKGAKLWHIANAMGHRACVVNVPVTYPPEPINGVMVSGMLTPSIEAEFTTPPIAKKELLHQFPAYKTDIDARTTGQHTYNHKQLLGFLEDAKNTTKTRAESFRWLLDKEKATCGLIVFEMSDRLQHFLWKQISYLPGVMDATSEAQEMRDQLLACFDVLDEQIGLLIDSYQGDETTTIFLSDHGFGPMQKNVHVNDWLAQQGWLAYDSLKGGGWQLLRRLGARFKRWIPHRVIKRTKQAIPLYKTFDWSKTMAYSGTPSEYGVFINVVGREPKGVVSSADYDSVRQMVIDALQAWEDPSTGQKIMTAVHRREDVYAEAFRHQAPDIIFELASGYYISDITSLDKHAVFTDISHTTWGFHERDGIFAIHGKNIGEDLARVVADAQDVTPTILHALDWPIPNDVDGRVLTELFQPEWTAKHPIQFAEPLNIEPEHAAVDDGGYSADDEALIEERLRSLGYLGE